MTQDLCAPSTVPDLSISGAARRLPWVALLALTLTSFMATANEAVPAGLLPQIALGLGVSQAWAGQFVTLCALGAGLAAIPMTTATRSWRRRKVLLLALAAFCICNAVTALSTHYGLTLVARFVVGVATGLAWSELATYARRLVPASLQGRALAIVMIGIPMALSLGVPLAAWLGRVIDWRWIFAGMCGIGVLLAAWVLAAVPDFPGQTRVQLAQPRQVLMTAGVRPVLWVVMLWVFSHYLLYTYIAPFLAVQGLFDRLDLVLLVFGLSTMLGLWGIGWLVDRHLRLLVLISLGVFAAAGIVLGLANQSAAAVLVGVAFWGLSFSGAPTLLQTALADAAGDHAEVAQSMLVTVFNLSFAGSGLVGGVLLESMGSAVFPWLLTASAGIAFWVVWHGRVHGFPLGRRQSSSC